MIFGHAAVKLPIKLFVAVLAFGTLLCLPLRPLWVDEIFQLEGTWQQPMARVVHNAMIAPGGMPLAYAAQKLWLDVAGFSPAKARVPAALFGLGASLLTGWIAALLGVNVSFVVIASLLTPLLFRYSTEARPYSQGLFFSCLATALLLSWLARPSPGRLALYFISCLGAAYSQPFALFIPATHVAYLLFTNRQKLLPVLLCVAAAGLLYAPWVLLSQEALTNESWPHYMFFSLAQVSPLMIVRELSGGGYFCSLSLLILALAGLRAGQHELLLWLCVAIPLALAILADAAFHYFFAIRQLIFVLPPLLLLAAAGLERLWMKRRTPATVFAFLFILSAVVKDVRWQLDRKEDWGKAASAIKTRLSELGASACVSIIPPGDAMHYYFFEPSLRARSCRSGVLQSQMLVVKSPYAPWQERQVNGRRMDIGNSIIVSP